jgi:hypothetical protein
MAAPRQLLIPDRVWPETLETLNAYARAEVEAGLYWYGLRNIETQVATVAAIGIPRQFNQPCSFEVDADDLAALTRRVPDPLVAVAAVHTHPGADTNHSPWDDLRVISRNILSLVLPFYGRDAQLADAAIHEYVDGRWTSLARAQTVDRVLVIPSLIDTRS